MVANAIPTQGISLRSGSNAVPPVYTHIAHVKGFDGPGGEATVINTSTLDSAAVEKMIGLMDEGTFTFRVNHMPNEPTQEALRADRASKRLVPFRLVLTDEDATIIGFEAYVRGYRVTGDLDGIVEAAVTLEISGPVDWDVQP